MNQNQIFIEKCKALLEAFKTGALGQTIMPEDSNPWNLKMNMMERSAVLNRLELSNIADAHAHAEVSAPLNAEIRLAYFTLPMALNYQRDSYKLWESALKTYNDPETRFVFDVSKAATVSEEQLRSALLKYKVALQPNKHIQTWKTISKTIFENWGSVESFVKASEGDFIKLRELVRIAHKKGFPYLSGPKIFNYWSFILSTYGGVILTNRDHIDIAPDTHITQCSVKLGVITQDESLISDKEEISERWRALLLGSGIDPIDMHPPLWFWSRNGFLFKI